jgi:PAS domain S-box-containing protein
MEEYVWISKLAHHPVFTTRVHPILRRLAHEYGVEITVAGPDDTSEEKYVQSVEDAIKRGVAGMMVIGWGGEDIIPAINAAVDNGIPVVTVDSDVPNCRRLAHVGTDWYRMGGAMADELATRINGQGKVLMLGMTDLDNMQAGFRGFQYRISAYSDMEVFGPEDDLDVTADRAQAIAAEYLQRHPDLAGIVGFDGNSGPGAAAALETAVKANTVKVICVDTGSPHLEYLKSGVIDALFAQKREAFTNLAFQMLYTYRHGSAATGYRPGAINIPGNVDTGYVVVTNKNIDSFETEFGIEDAFRRHDLSQRLTLTSGMLDNSAEIALAGDLEGRIVYANRAALRYLDLDEGQLSESALEKVMGFKEKHNELMKKCLSDKSPASFQIVIPDINKEKRAFRVSMSPLIVNEIVRGITITASDITDKRRIREVRRRERVLIKRMMETSPAGITLVDNEGQIRFANAMAERVLGLSRDVITQRAYNAPEWRITDYDGNPFPNRELPFFRIKETRQPVYDIRHAIEDSEGTRTLLSINAAPLFDESGQFDGMVATVDDVTERVRAREELEVSEEKYSHLFQYLHDAVFVHDLEGNIVDVNEKATELFGYDKNEMLGLSIAQIHPPEEKEISQKAFADISRDGFVSFEAKFIKKNGEAFLAEVASSLFTIGDRTVIQGIVRDVTLRKETEEALRNSEERFHLLSDAAEEGIAIHDQGLVIDANDALARILGYGQSELIGMHMKDLLTPESLEIATKNIAAGYDRPYELNIVRKDGSIVECQLVGKPFKHHGKGLRVVALRDISELKRAERELRQSEAKSRALLDAIPDLMFQIDSNGKFIGYQANSTEILLMPPEEFIGKYVSDVLPPEAAGQTMDAVQKALSTGEVGIFEYDLPMNGEVREYEARITTSGEGTALAIVRDITERKQAEESIRESEEQFRVSFQTSPDAMAISDIETGKFFDINDGFEQLTGYARDEVIGRTSVELGIWNDPESRDRAIRFLKDHGYIKNMEIKLGMKDSRVRTCLMSGNIISLKGKSYLLTAARDIDELAQAQEALRESEERFRTFFQTSPDVMVISNLLTGEMFDVNEKFESLAGYTRDEVIGISSKDLRMWADPAVRDKMVQELQKHGQIRNMEADFRVKDGSKRTCLVSCNIIVLQGESYLFTISRDIEELKQAQKAFQESEERFRTIFESAQDAIFMKDRDLRFMAVNPSLAGFFGMESEQFIGHTYGELFGPGSVEFIESREQNVLKGEIINTEAVLPVGDQPHTLHVVIVPMKDPNGDIIGLCGFSRDITETKRLQEFSERARRLETAGKIAGQVAHDFNNLLGPLVAYPGLMRDELPSDHPVVEFIDDMEKAAEQMAEINQQLLTLGRRGHYNMEPLDINRTIQEVIDRSEPFPEGLELTTELNPEVLNIKGGASQIYRVIHNLVANALDAMPGGGRLTIKTENYYVNRDSGAYKQIPRGEYVKLTMTDSGIGIPEDGIARIFDPFYTTKTADRKRGSGLGLSVVHAVVEDHGGYIDVTSNPDKGTSFYLYFPITRQPIEIVETDSVSGGSETVLVVDDDPVQRDVTSKLLDKLGYQVSTAASGEQALMMFADRRRQLLILDMVMPAGIDGAETYRQALELNPSQRAIIVSGFAGSDRVQKALDLGAGAFLKKPLTLIALASAVRKELDRKAEKPAG